MRCRAPAKQRPPIPDAVPQRCAELGLPVWWLDQRGGVRSEPDVEGIAGLWIRTLIDDATARAAADAWSRQDAPSPHVPWPGCALVPVPEVVRRRRTGYLVALALAPEALAAPEFAAVCRAAFLDEPTARRALTPIARIGADEADRLAIQLRWMTDDLAQRDRATEEIAGFTTQLTDAYETVHALYAIGRRMNRVNAPAEFLREVVDQIAQTLQFTWVACCIAPDATGRPDLDAASVTAGVPDEHAHAWRDVVAFAWDRAHDEADERTLILSEDEGLPAGADTQVVVQPIRVGPRLVAFLAAGGKGGPDPQVSSYDTLMIEAAGGFARAFLENVALYAEQHTAFLGTVRAMTTAIDAKDQYTRGHSERVAALSRRIALAAGMSEPDAECIHFAGLVHDVGKIGVPESVLCKAGRLNDEEFEQIKLHPEIGMRILRDVPSLERMIPGVLHHHERWDGRGYPHGLAGEDVPLMARIIGIADTFDAMSSTRSYRPAMPREAVLAEIQRCAGAQFDPDLARLFATLDLTEYDRMVAEHRASEPEFRPSRAA